RSRSMILGTDAALASNRRPSSRRADGRYHDAASGQHATRGQSKTSEPGAAACWPDDIRNTTGVTSKFISIGPAWPDMANKNKSANRINDLIANETPRFETLSSNESQMQKDILLRRTFNASSSFNTYP